MVVALQVLNLPLESDDLVYLCQQIASFVAVNERDAADFSQNFIMISSMSSTAEMEVSTMK